MARVTISIGIRFRWWAKPLVRVLQVACWSTSAFSKPAADLICNWGARLIVDRADLVIGEKGPELVHIRG